MALKDWIYKLLGKAGSKAEAEAQPAAETPPEPPVNISGLLIDYNGLPFKPEHDEVIYVNGSGDTTVDNLVSANLDALTAAFAARDLRFVYPQELGRCLRASVVHNQRAPLLLGQSVLGRLGHIEIDNSRQVIRIKPVH